jgi:hypothetical protein
MTMPTNPSLEQPLNVLHDQGVPNTLRGMSPPAPLGSMRLPLAAFTIVAIGIMALLILLVARLA